MIGLSSSEIVETERCLKSYWYKKHYNLKYDKARQIRAKDKRQTSRQNLRQLQGIEEKAKRNRARENEVMEMLENSGPSATLLHASICTALHDWSAASQVTGKSLMNAYLSLMHSYPIQVYRCQNFTLITYGVADPTEGSMLSSEILGQNCTDLPVQLNQLLEEEMILTADVKKLLSRPAQGEGEDFDWLQIWEEKGSIRTGKGRGSVCKSCHQNYVGRPGKGCTDSVRLFRHKILGDLLEVQMDKAISHRKPYECWMYSAWILNGCQSWEKEGSVQSLNLKTEMSHRLMI